VPPNSFKSDESFLEKLAVGAAGTKATMNRLRELGFRPIELERGSSGYKIWKQIKIKRIRVPDIICLRTGKRFESRGKTKLEISMSHSLKDPNRAWDAGMRSDDMVAVVQCARQSDSIVDWAPCSPIHFVLVADMQAAYRKKRVTITKPKGVEEGSEIRIIWPSAISDAKSIVTEITGTSVRLSKMSGERPQRCLLKRKIGQLLPQCRQGEEVQQNQIVASIVRVELEPTVGEPVTEAHFMSQLGSAGLSERYGAAKALRFLGYQRAGTLLGTRMNDSAEDLYVKLEAAAALAAHDHVEGWTFLTEALSNEYSTIQLETVIVLSEITQGRSEELLKRVLFDTNRHIEVRAGAAWALGEFLTETSSEALVSTFNVAETEIKVEAARALLKIAPAQVGNLVAMIKTIEPGKRDGIAWALARVGRFDPAAMLNEVQDDNLRGWLAYIVGYGKELFSTETIENLSSLDPKVYFTASVLWQILGSWTRDLKEY
jgi:HEAT repeat protein